MAGRGPTAADKSNTKTGELFDEDARRGGGLQPQPNALHTGARPPVNPAALPA